MGTHDFSTKIPNTTPDPTARKCYGVQINANPLKFCNLHGGHFRLEAAFNEPELQKHLLGSDLPVTEFKNHGTKYTIQIHIEGQIKFSKQKYSKYRDSLRTLGGVARQVAEVVKEYIEKTEHNIPNPAKDRWRLGPGYIEFEDIYLKELCQVSKASWQVVLGYHHDRSHEAPQHAPSAAV
ncbi:hypothetical protein BDY19DRAFT_992115 [Irpex rosettiformis]|uniref:Uncharacterized protein n=1 Tax=Irpex rosettiformis TaxID=378272 RepID=A0ACB8U8T9_9APHY|nr:hypothetical protein BDY19DRAFT_992115 [Irpex rosettiformis]